MRYIAFVFLFSMLFVYGYKAPRKQKVAELDIVEVVFRYQFKHNASGVQQKAKGYYISFMGKDPSVAFLKRFAKHKPPVFKGSKFVIGHGLLFSVSLIKWINKDKVEVSGGYYEAGMSSSGNTYTVERKNGKWKVTKNVMNWIS